MKNKIKLSLAVLAMLVVVTNSSGMVKPAGSVRSQVPSEVPATANILSLPNDILSNNLLENLKEPSLQVTVKNIRSFAHAYPKFFRLLADSPMTSSLINQLSQNHNVRPVQVFLELRTKGGADWLKKNIDRLDQEDLILIRDFFMKSARSGSNGKVAYLISSWPAIANINAAYPLDMPAETALAIAARGENLDVVDTLIKAGANVNQGDSSNLPPLHIAAICDNPEIVGRLLDAGALVSNRTGDSGSTPFGHAYSIQRPKRKAVISLLRSRMGWRQWTGSWLGIG